MKSSNLSQDLKKLYLAPAENELLIQQYLDQNLVTFFSWKIFKIRLNKEGEVAIKYNFDTKEANQFIQRELQFLKLLKKYQVEFRYLKLIPDELLNYFWNESIDQNSIIFKNQVEKYFNQFVKTDVILFSELLKDSKLQKIYNQVFERVYKSFDKSETILVGKTQFNEEVKIRSNYYTDKNLSILESQELAKKAFALFAAETALLFELQKQNIFPNLVLLAGERSIDTYKYEFFKYPKNRPILPKLFVI